MKKLILGGCLLLSAFVSAGDELVNSPIYFSSDTINPVVKLSQPVLMQFNYPGVGARNCITDLSVSNVNFPASTWSFYILDGQSGATAYTMIQSTGVIFEDFYKGNPLCLGNSTTTYFYVSSGTFKLNASGYVR